MRATRAAVVAALLLTSGCTRSQTSGPQGFPPVAVKLATVRASDIEDASEYVASLKSLHSTTIQPQIDGQITQIYVKSGDRVKEGAPLLQIDPRHQQAGIGAGRDGAAHGGSQSPGAAGPGAAAAGPVALLHDHGADRGGHRRHPGPGRESDLALDALDDDRSKRNARGVHLGADR